MEGLPPGSEEEEVPRSRSRHRDSNKNRDPRVLAGPPAGKVEEERALPESAGGPRGIRRSHSKPLGFGGGSSSGSEKNKVPRSGVRLLFGKSSKKNHAPKVHGVLLGESKKTGKLPIRSGSSERQRVRPRCGVGSFHRVKEEQQPPQGTDGPLGEPMRNARARDGHEVSGAPANRPSSPHQRLFHVEHLVRVRFPIVARGGLRRCLSQIHDCPRWQVRQFVREARARRRRSVTQGMVTGGGGPQYR